METSDGTVTGRFEQSLVTGSGTVVTRTASLSAAADGPSAVLTLTAEQFLGGSTTISAALDGQQLALTGKGTDLRVRVGDLEEYRSALTALSLSAEIGRQTQIEIKALGEFRAINSAAAKFATETVDRLTRFAPTEVAFWDGTARMRKGLAKEHSIAGDGEASFARSQISVAMS